MLGAEEPHLLLDAENDLDTAVGGDPRPATRQDGQNDRDPGLVVRPEDGLAVAVYHAVADTGVIPSVGPTVSMWPQSSMVGPAAVPGTRTMMLPVSLPVRRAESSTVTSRPVPRAF